MTTLVCGMAIFFVVGIVPTHWDPQFILVSCVVSALLFSPFVYHFYKNWRHCPTETTEFDPSILYEENLNTDQGAILLPNGYIIAGSLLIPSGKLRFRFGNKDCLSVSMYTGRKKTLFYHAFAPGFCSATLSVSPQTIRHISSDVYQQCLRN